MKKLLTIIISCTLALATFFAFSGCSKNKNEVVDVTTKQIVVGYTDYAPMNYKENGVLKGFDTELAITVFNALGYDVKFKLIDWSNKYVELNNDTIGCVWNGFTANSTDEGKNRSELVDFSLYYMENGQCLITKNSNKITSLEGLAGKSLAYETGSAADSLINGENSMFNGISINKQGLTSQMDACEAVRNGNKDYAVVDIILAKDLLANNSGYSNFTICEDIDLGIEYYAIAFKKGSELTDKVNVILKALKEVGYIDELAKKYGVENAITDFTQNV